MRKKINKPWFRQKGRYKDGRKKVVIEWEEDGKIKSKALPKPEVLLDWTVEDKNPSEKETVETPDSVPRSDPLREWQAFGGTGFK